jgi:biopolymer transport protein ExbD
MQINGGGSGGLQSEINVTPLVDVVLVLLIIFMVVVPLLMQGHNVDIPRTSADGAPAPADERQVILSIQPAACRIVGPSESEGLPADCRVSLAERDIAASDLPAGVAELLGSRPAERRVLFVAADDSLNYEGVLRLVDLAKLNVPDLSIDVIPAETGGRHP